MKSFTVGIALALLFVGRVQAQTTFGVNIIVSEEAAPEGYVYRYRVVNTGSSRSGQFMLGFDADEGDASLRAMPTTIRSPFGWQAATVSGDGATGFAVAWRTTDMTDMVNVIPPNGELAGFEVVLPKPDPAYRSTKATVTFDDGNQDVVTVRPTVMSSDVLPPTVEITSPEAGKNATNTVVVRANASDNVGVLDVRFLLDGQDIEPAAGSEPAPDRLTWDTLGAVNGPHVLTAIARDAAGNTTISAPIRVTVVNNVTPPTVALTSPTAGGVVRGTATLTAAPQAVHSIKGVFFFVDGVSVGPAIGTPPFSQSWNSSAVPNGPHLIHATVVDAAGRHGRTATVSVTVAN